MSKKRPLTECPVCGNLFKQLSQNTKVCSVECRFVMYTNQSGVSECWEWSGPRVFDGYGRLFIEQSYETGKRKSIAAHRYAYEKHHDVVVPETMCVMHKCDNPSCVNPNHLEIGTWADNNGDRSRKGRSGSRVFTDEDKAKYSKIFGGTNNPAAKITEDQARSIKYGDYGISASVLAKQIGVSVNSVWRIRSGKAWSNV